jgi:hypothetical protein
MQIPQFFVKTMITITITISSLLTMQVHIKTSIVIYSRVIGAGWPDQLIRVDAPTSRGRVALCLLSVTLVPLCANKCFACLNLSC